MCTAKPRQQKPNQAVRVADDLFAEGQTSVPVENRGKTELVSRADANNDDDIFADTFSSSFKTKPRTGVSRPATATMDDDIFAASSAVKTTRQSKKASDVTNVFNIDNDDEEDDIFAIKPPSISNVKNPVAAFGNATQKVCRLCLINCSDCMTFLIIVCECHKIDNCRYTRNMLSS